VWGVAVVVGVGYLLAVVVWVVSVDNVLVLLVVSVSVSWVLKGR
jgi:hypothetical protein